MPRSLLQSDSQILLIGVPVPDADMTLGTAWPDTKKLALIYKFYYQNETANLAKPTIFVVEGDGTPLANPVNDPSFPVHLEDKGDLEPSAAFWMVDRSDHLVRIDTSTGDAGDVLLTRELGVIDTEAMHGRGAEPMRTRRRWRSLDSE
ncbi:MAG: hypothetical protein AAFR52_01775 [Pseudomonadota bacterium]